MNPYRVNTAGNVALENGQRRRVQKGPDAPQHESAAMRPFDTANVRPVVSRFGGMVLESHAVHIPTQGSFTSVGAMDNDNDFDSRCKPEITNVFAGIPGYAGYKPHGSHPSVLGTNAAPAAHDRPTAQLDTSSQPYIMPVVGYSGHIRGLADADRNYGTTHWKNSGFVNPTHKPAASRPWDGRDIAGRPYGGQTPGDFGRYHVDPDEYDAATRTGLCRPA